QEEESLMVVRERRYTRAEKHFVGACPLDEMKNATVRNAESRLGEFRKSWSGGRQRRAGTQRDLLGMKHRLCFAGELRGQLALGLAFFGKRRRGDCGVAGECLRKRRRICSFAAETNRKEVLGFRMSRERRDECIHRSSFDARGRIFLYRRYRFQLERFAR